MLLKYKVYSSYYSRRSKGGGAAQVVYAAEQQTGSFDYARPPATQRALYAGSNARALEKARTLPADALIFDLEDAVAPDAKLLAREQVCEAVHAGGYGGREIVIRVNALETPWGAEDLIAACAAEPDAILVPKVVYSGDILSAAKILQSVHAAEKIRLWAMMETPMAILNARTIAATAVHAENRLCCLVMGTNDLLKESRARALHDRFAVVPWLAMTIVAARAYRLDIIDGVYNYCKDEIGLREECEHGRTLGMDGKTLIHPSQVGPCNEIFSPTDEEVALARKIISAFSRPENAKKGVIVVEGRMVERLHLAMAMRTAAIAEQIGEMEREVETVSFMARPAPVPPLSPWGRAGSLQHLEEKHAWDRFVETDRCIGVSRRPVGVVAAGSDTGNLGAARFEVLEGEFIHGPADAVTLQSRVDGVQPDLTGFSLRVDKGEDEAGDDAIGFRDINPFVRVGRRNLPQRIGVLLSPIAILKLEDLASQRLLEAFVDRLERSDAHFEDTGVIRFRIGPEAEAHDPYPTA